VKTAPQLMEQYLRAATKLPGDEGPGLYYVMTALRGPDNQCSTCKDRYTQVIRATLNQLMPKQKLMPYQDMAPIPLQRITTLVDELESVILYHKDTADACPEADEHFLRHAWYALIALKRWMMQKETASR